MSTLRFRAPGHPVPLLALLERALPGVSVERIASWASTGTVRVEGRPAPAARLPVAPGALVLAREVPRAPALFQPVPRGTSRFVALVPEPPWRSGTLTPSKQGAPALHFELGETRNGVARLRLEAKDAEPLRVARMLATAGFPVLGDPLHGGVLVAGGVRLRAGGGEDDLDWPDEHVFLPRWTPGDPNAVLAVSGSTLRAMRRGHPWVLPDRETGDVGRFRPGTLVRLVAAREARGKTASEARGKTASEARGRTAGEARGKTAIEARGGADHDAPWVCIEGGAVAARAFAPNSSERDATNVEARIAKALARRRELVFGASPETTDAFRLVHGEADGLPGLAVDRLGPLLRVLVAGRACEAFRERALDALVRALARDLGGEPPVVEVIHLREPPPGELECVRLLRGRRAEALGGPDGRLLVHERGLAFHIDAGLRAPTQATPGVGLFLDQRENRARLATLAKRGGRWLNLFAHTGAFSVALLAAGASEVVSVDLSKAYLHWLEDNLAANALQGARHRPVCGDGRRVLEKLPEGERFDGIVIDPPTAAAAGRRFWSVRRDLPLLVEGALRRLAPGGALLVTRNDRTARGALGALVRAAAGRGGVSLARIVPAPPGPDFPSLPGFPEGDPFEGVLALRSAR